MRYITSSDHKSLQPKKRVESCFIPTIGGILVIEESAWCAADIVQSHNQRLDYGKLHISSITREQLLDLRECIDTVLKEFEHI